MTRPQNSPRKGGLIREFTEAARDAWSSGPFAFLVFLMLCVGPALAIVYIMIAGVLSLFGVELAALPTSVE